MGRRPSPAPRSHPVTGTMTDLLLEATGVAKRYGAVAALRDASLSVAPGEVHALLGANGAGKSTFVKILTGAIHPDAGTIRVARHGSPSSARPPRRVARASSPSTRSPSLVPDLEVAENLRLTETPIPAFRRLLGDLGISELDLRAYVRELPLPTLRVIDLARALAAEPDLLLLDEMTAALPADLTERVLDVVGKVREIGPVGHLHLPPDARDRAPCATGRRSSATVRPWVCSM